jgi:tetratricopeptide (TPR) repeat protein
MNDFFLKGIVISVGILSAATLTLVSFEYGTLKEAGRLSKEGKHDDALKRYNNQLVKYLHPDIVSVNMGAVLYHKGEYQKAANAFRKTLASPDPSSRARSLYNMGNCRYRQGERLEQLNPENAASLYREALDYYQTAVHLNPGDADARYNLDLAGERLSVIAQRTGQNDGRQRTTGDTRSSDESQKNRNATDARDREAGRESRNHAGAKNSAADALKEKRSDTRIEPQQTRIKKGEMSRNEAELLLEEYRQREEHLGRPGSTTAKGYHSPVVKDW